jgi:hypothetical protein
VNPSVEIRRSVALLVLAGACAVAAGPTLGDDGPRLAVVYLADGTSVPLQDWALCYEYLAQAPGALSAEGRVGTRESHALWLAKGEFPLQAATLEVDYADVREEREIQGEIVVVGVPQPRGLRLVTTDGRTRTLKPEPPSRARLQAEGDRGLVIVPRGLDIRGRTFSGIARRFCLLSFHTLVECRPDPKERVARIVFQP